MSSLANAAWLPPFAARRQGASAGLAAMALKKLLEIDPGRTGLTCSVHGEEARSEAYVAAPFPVTQSLALLLALPRVGYVGQALLDLCWVALVCSVFCTCTPLRCSMYLNMLHAFRKFLVAGFVLVGLADKADAPKALGLGKGWGRALAPLRL